MGIQHKRKIQKTAHFSTIGDPTKTIEELWIVCHGYGQLASKFIDDFHVLKQPGRLIVAPEGLSRFYWGGFTGPVVSSWMTSGHRLDEIEDYCNWLDSLYAELQSMFFPNIKITILGFSQGTATVMRWLHARQPNIHQLILWAGMTPEDISYLELTDYFKKINKIFVYGTEDKFITSERLEWHAGFLKEQKLDFQVLDFEGKHRMDDELLRSISNNEN